VYGLITATFLPFARAFVSGTIANVYCFKSAKTPIRFDQPTSLFVTENQSDIDEGEYTNFVAKFLGNFISPRQSTDNVVPEIDTIDWGVTKRKPSSLENLASDLFFAIKQKQWFVTGNVDPSFFATDFAFQDPDVKIKGIESYARGVHRIFKQNVSKAEVISVVSNGETSPPTITITWRLDCTVNLGHGIKIKPFLVYTDFDVCDRTGLITFQKDRFSIPGYDIFLGSFFPFLQPFLSPPAAPISDL